MQSEKILATAVPFFASPQAFLLCMRRAERGADDYFR